MPISEKRQLNILADKKDLDMYQRLYPYSLTRYLKACIHMAIKDKELVFKMLGKMADEERNK